LLCFWCPSFLAAEDQATGALFLPNEKFKSLDKAEPPPGAAVGERRITMRPRFPQPRAQGIRQSSCVGFAVAYALKSYLDSIQLGWSDFGDDHVYSPAFIYNQFSNDHGTSGIYIQQALAYLQGGGCCSWKMMPYDPNDADSKPTRDIIDAARQSRIASWEPVNVRDINKMKSYLVTQIPVAIGAWVDVQDRGTWGQNSKGITDHYLHEDRNQQGYHSMVVIGYDDDKGAFEIINSWGPNWGDAGYGWIDYKFWPSWVNEGYIAINTKTTSLAPGSAITAKDIKWLPVGPEGKVNGNWGFPWNVNLKALKPSKDKTLPVEVKQYLPKSFQKSS